MSANFFDTDDADQLHSDFLDIMEAPHNQIASFKKEVERLGASEDEPRVELGSFVPMAATEKYTFRRYLGTFVIADAGASGLSLPRSEAKYEQISHYPGPFFMAETGPVVQEPRVTLGYSRFYRIAWFVLLIISMAWGLILGASLAGMELVGPVTAASGVIGLVGLGVTLIIAGRRTTHGRV
jgi:hypothetical protein